MTDEREPDFSTVESPSSRSLDWDDFTHESIIARTATTVVHRVKTVTGKSLAVKHPIQQDTLSQDVYHKFKQEADNWTQLDDHPNIVGIVDWGEDPLPWLHHDAPLPWIAMEDMDGGTLDDYAGEVPVDQALWIAEQITDAVWYAHHPNGAVHLDLKPANILFRETPNDSWNVPKVADWELARTLLTHTNSVGIATPQYTSPEQTRNDDTGPFTDQFQLGIIFYELFTGEYPFLENPLDAPPQALVSTVADPEVSPPTEYNPVLPDELNNVLQTTLATNPHDRYDTVRDLREELTAIRQTNSSSSGESVNRNDATDDTADEQPSNTPRESSDSNPEITESDTVNNSESTPFSFNQAEKTILDYEPTAEDIKTEFYCPECDLTRHPDRCNMRAGDICPECKRGYISERPT